MSNPLHNDNSYLSLFACRSVLEHIQTTLIAIIRKILSQEVALSAGTEVEASPVDGPGFRMEKAGPKAASQVFIFATGSGITPIKALIESGNLQVSHETQTMGPLFSHPSGQNLGVGNLVGDQFQS